MKVRDLDDAGLAILVALCDRVAAADGAITEGETDLLALLRVRTGLERWEAARTAPPAVDRPEQLMDLAETVSREAHDAILTVLVNLSRIDGISVAERELLTTLISAWDQASEAPTEEAPKADDDGEETTKIVRRS